MMDSKAEANTSIFHASSLGFPRSIHIDAKLHEYLSTTATGSTPVSVFRHLGTRGGGDNGGRGRNIEQLSSTTGTGGIE
jgi:hypothetical protein